MARSVRGNGARDKEDLVHSGGRPPAALGVTDGDAVLVRSAHGELRARPHLAPMRPGNVQPFVPEANPLLSPTVREPQPGVPDYDAIVEVVPVR